jgi:hypothetical protein
LLLQRRREQKATVVAATSSPAKIVELKQGETLIADCDLVKGFTKGIEEDYRKLGQSILDFRF